MPLVFESLFQFDLPFEARSRTSADDAVRFVDQALERPTVPAPDASTSARDFAFEVEIDEAVIGRGLGFNNFVMFRRLGQSPGAQNGPGFQHQVPMKAGKIMFENGISGHSPTTKQARKPNRKCPADRV